MFDFPNSPTNGQLVTGPGGIQYQWDGVKWVGINSGAPGFAPINNPVFTGDPQAPTPPPNDNDQSIPNTAWVQGAVTRPNKLINPFMEIDQANEGAAVNATTSAYIVDGYRGLSSTTGTMNGGSSNSAPPGFRKSIFLSPPTGAASVGAANYTMFQCPMEANDTVDLALGTAGAATVTLSLWASLGVVAPPYTFAISLVNPASNRSYVVPLTITAAAGSWQHFTTTIQLDTAGTWTPASLNAIGMVLQIAAAAGTNFQTATPNTWLAGNFFATTAITNTIQTTSTAALLITGVKLEVGPQATPMLRQSFQAELARCQRYYEKSYDIGTALGTTSSGSGLMAYQNNLSGANSAGTINVIYKTTKRAVPTVTFYSPATGAAGKLRDGYLGVDVTPTVQPGSTTQVAVYGLTSQSGGVQMNCHYVADARL